MRHDSARGGSLGHSAADAHRVPARRTATSTGEVQMSADSQPRRERAPKSKVRPITEPDDLLREGLPCNVDAERFILGAVLLDGRRFSEIATLTADDFALERHQRVFRAMRDLPDAGE